MKAVEVSKFPVTLNFPPSQPVPKSIHESLFRSYHILNKVIEELEAGTPAKAILELVEIMQANPTEENIGDRIER